MNICICHGITDHDIRRGVAPGMSSFAQLRQLTGCSDCCGSCETEARQVFDEALPPTLRFVSDDGVAA